jgi:hypothetical protein
MQRYQERSCLGAVVFVRNQQTIRLERVVDLRQIRASHVAALAREGIAAGFDRVENRVRTGEFGAEVVAQRAEVAVVGLFVSRQHELRGGQRRRVALVQLREPVAQPLRLGCQCFHMDRRIFVEGRSRAVGHDALHGLEPHDDGVIPSRHVRNGDSLHERKMPRIEGRRGRDIPFYDGILPAWAHCGSQHDHRVDLFRRRALGRIQRRKRHRDLLPGFDHRMVEMRLK